jgi:hypothetical protein
MELEHFGNPEVNREVDNLGMAKLFKEHLLEQMRRVLQPPKCERTLACRFWIKKSCGKIDLSEKIDRFVLTNFKS